METFAFTPIVIVGAGRSGTNVLRDTLTSLGNIESWPCDEINPIWRHGNLFWPDDEIPAERATPEVVSFIRKEFVKLWESRGKPKYIVEKTCANSLRVPFVASVLPEARFIHLVRNGFDVAASSEKRWRGEFEFPKVKYLLSKARYAPVRDLPTYAFRFVSARAKAFSGQSNHLSLWGPHFSGMAELSNAALIDICILQWINCIESADEGLSSLKQHRVVEIKYEELVTAPLDVLKNVLGIIASEMVVEDRDIVNAITQIRPPASSAMTDYSSLNISPEVLERLLATLKRKGYDVMVE